MTRNRACVCSAVNAAAAISVTKVGTSLAMPNQEEINLLLGLNKWKELRDFC